MTNDDLTVFRERNTRKRLSNAAALIGKRMTPYLKPAARPDTRNWTGALAAD